MNDHPVERAVRPQERDRPLQLSSSGLITFPARSVRTRVPAIEVDEVDQERCAICLIAALEVAPGGLTCALCSGLECDAVGEAAQCPARFGLIIETLEIRSQLAEALRRHRRQRVVARLPLLTPDLSESA